MNQKPIHILMQLGILTSFSVAKKISEKEITTFFNRKKHKGKSNDKIAELLKQHIISDIQEAITNNKVPGLISPLGIPNLNSVGKDIPNFSELNKTIMLIVEKMIEKKYDKFSLCFFINTLVNLLGLSEKDFEKFHRRMSSQTNEDDEDEDDVDN